MNHEIVNAWTQGKVTTKHVSQAVSQELTYKNIGFINNVQKDR